MSTTSSLLRLRISMDFSIGICYNVLYATDDCILHNESIMYTHPTADAGYSWKDWSDGRTWTLKKGVHFKGTHSRIIAEAKSYAQKIGMQVEARHRNNWVILRFFRPVRTLNTASK